MILCKSLLTRLPILSSQFFSSSRFTLNVRQGLFAHSSFLSMQEDVFAFLLATFAKDLAIFNVLKEFVDGSFRVISIFVFSLLQHFLFSFLFGFLSSNSFLFIFFRFLYILNTRLDDLRKVKKSPKELFR